MEEIFKGETCVAQYNAERERIEFAFNGYANIEEHKKMYEEVFKYLTTHKTVAFIMDFRNIAGTFTMLNDWVIEKLRPAVALGLKKSALILNEDVFTAFAANDALKKVSLIEIQVFKNSDDVEQWLS